MFDAGGRLEHIDDLALRRLRDYLRKVGDYAAAEIVSLLQQNLQQEESTARLIEQSTPDLLQKAMQKEGMTGTFAQTQKYEQAGPSF